MIKCIFQIVGVSIFLTAALWADGSGLDRDQKNLGKMEASRSKDQAHKDRAQKDLSQGTAKLSFDHEQQRQDVEQLQSVDTQVTEGHAQEKRDTKSYHEAVKKYGRDAPAATTAKQTLQDSHDAMKPLRQNQKDLKTSIQSSHMVIHNDKTMNSVQQRVVDSDTQYLDQDDRAIEKKEKKIADNNHEVVLEKGR